MQTPWYNSSFTISGTAPANAVVTLHFHRGGTAPADFSLLRTVTADNNGRWSRPVVANVDYAYYATAGSASSQTVQNQPAASLDGPLSRVVAVRHLFALGGTAVPGSTVYLHLHRPGTAANDFTLVRSVVADRTGRWTRPYLATADYRLYVSRTPAAAPAAKSIYLLQAR